VPLQPGTRLGPYEILSALGAGGMGEVYRARDTKLNRDVAIKVLPELFLLDADRLARFRREAQVLASLNHPNIAAIHGFEETGGLQALVLELVEGPTLADVIAQVASGSGRLGISLDDALPIARQVAEALEAAHDQGIVHRDLKPANVKVRPDGTVKVLDFGLAKALESDIGSTSATMSPTLTSPMATRTGVILGTAAYMAPEQARGKPVDKRADLWAFGCVLYELLTGRRAFAGDEISDVLAEVLKSDPDWRALPLDTPPAIHRLLRRCLAKDRKARLSDAAVARLEIDEALAAPAADTAPTGAVVPPASRTRERLAWISVAVLALVAVAALARAFRPVPTAAEMRFEITTPPTTSPVSLAISPDGQKVAFVATVDGQTRLWLRSFDATSAHAFAGTESALHPFWSPDGRSIGFFADGKLKRINVDGSVLQAIAGAPNGTGGTWNRDNVIVFAPNGAGTLFRVSATGGEPVAVTQAETGQPTSHSFPQFLPDDRHFLYRARANRIYVGQLDGGEPRHLLDADSGAMYSATGHLLFVRQGTLFAQSFDPARLSLTGNPIPLAERIAVDPNGGQPALSTSAAGPILYRTGTGSIERQLIWFDRSGKDLSRIGDPDAAVPADPSLSPDGRSLAESRNVNGRNDIWLVDLERAEFNRFTSDGSIFPVWSPDGRRIAYNRNRAGSGLDLYRRPIAGAEGEELLLGTPQLKTPMDWSSDEHFLLYRVTDPETNFDLWALPLQGGRKPIPIARTSFSEREGQFSPDGKWVAYQSDESGRSEIYVQSFPEPSNKWRISTNGGAQVRWRRDGKEVFYIGLDDRLMAVSIQLSAGAPPTIGMPAPLFASHIGGAIQPTVRRHQYVVSPDGQRFLMSTILDAATASPITVLLNWKPGN
jgi:Tol biopolymer transport system component